MTRKHVFKDLRPYVCTFRDCLKSDRLFGSRHDWYNHEVEVHRREWFCNACTQPFPTKALFEAHLRKYHFDLFTEAQLSAVTDRCERAIDPESEQTCPLCQEKYLRSRLQSHLAHHMQQLALFTLPKAVGERHDGGRGSDGASVRVQASNQGEEESSVDLASSSSSQELMGSVSDTQNEIPDTTDETWGHLKPAGDPEYVESRLESGTRAPDVKKSPYLMLSLTAEKLELQIMKDLENRLGPEHPDTMTSMSSLASMYWDQERRAEAEGLQVQVMEGRKRILGEEHPDTLEAIEKLASMYWSQARRTEAEELQVHVLERSRMILGEDHTGTLEAMANLALMLRSRGLLNEAEELLLRVLKGRKTALGENHPDTLAAMAILASTYRSQGRVREAEGLQEQVVEERKRALEVNHLDILEAIEDLASTFGEQGRWAEADSGRGPPRHSGSDGTSGVEVPEADALDKSGGV